METEIQNVLILLGPTAAGKSASAVFLAGRFGGEVINCDSTQVYQGFDIGTDKISPEEKKGIPHHLLDRLDPGGGVQFTAMDFVREALEAIRDIQRRGRLPLIVGGTGLYLRALLEGLFPGPGRDEALRRRLEEEARQAGTPRLWQRLAEVDPDYARTVGRNDKVRIVRALEVQILTGIPLSQHFARTKPFLEDFHLLKIGLQLERKELYRRIEERVEKMFAKGIVEETRALLRRGVAEAAPPFRALGYRHVLRHLKGELTLEEAVALTQMDTRRYAKRQMTWFRKMKDVCWFSPEERERLAEHVEQSLIRARE